MPDFLKIPDKTALYQAADTENIKAVVGGINPEYFAPSANVSFKFQSGQEQAFFNICDDLTQVKTDQAVESQTGNKISVRDGDVESTFELFDYSMKIERIFHTKPTEAPRYKLAFTEGVSFYYQGELTPEEISWGSVRPDNVVGSYAVYCDKKDHFKDESGNTIVNYGCGKIGHLYAPYWTDAAGKKIKGTQEIVGNILTFELPPQEWLDFAVLPIKLDPDLGYTTTPATDSTWPGTMVLKATATENGTLDSVSFYYHSSVSVNTIGLVYDSSNDLHAYSSAASSKPSGWATYTLGSESISNGTEYRVGRVSNGSVSWSYDSGPSGTTLYKGSNYANPPEDPLSSPSSGPWYIGAYATYTAGSSVLPINVLQKLYQQQDKI